MKHNFSELHTENFVYETTKLRERECLNAWTLYTWSLGERERAGKQDYRPVLGIPTKELIVLLP